jgi:hypothetical protein
MDDGAEEFAAGVAYRCAYGLAARLAEAESHGSALTGRARASSAAGGTAARILAAVVERYGDGPDVREGVADALSGRPPRW